MDKEQYLTSYIKNKQSKQKQTKRTKTNKAVLESWPLQRIHISTVFYKNGLVEYFDIYIIFMSTIRGLCNMKQTEHWQAVILELRPVNKEKHYNQ